MQTQKASLAEKMDCITQLNILPTKLDCFPLVGFPGIFRGKVGGGRHSLVEWEITTRRHMSECKECKECKTLVEYKQLSKCWGCLMDYCEACRPPTADKCPGCDQAWCAECLKGDALRHYRSGTVCRKCDQHMTHEDASDALVEYACKKLRMERSEMFAAWARERRSPARPPIPCDECSFTSVVCNMLRSGEDPRLCCRCFDDSGECDGCTDEAHNKTYPR